MTRRRKLLLPLAALALGLVVVLLIRNREPRYQGRTISEWADLGLKATDTVPWDMPNVLLASNAIHQIGAESFPWLRSRFPRANNFRSKISPILDSLPAVWSAGLASSQNLGGDRLSFSLYALGESALPLVPELATLDYFYPGYFFSMIGTPALPALIPMLTNSPPNPNASRVLILVQRWGEDAAEAGPVLWRDMQLGQIPTYKEPWLLSLAATGYRGDEFAQLLLARIPGSGEPPPDYEMVLATLALIPKNGPETLVGLLDHPSKLVQLGAMEALANRCYQRIDVRAVGGRPIFRVEYKLANDGREMVTTSDASALRAVNEASESVRLRVVELATELHAARLASGYQNSFEKGEHVLIGLAKDSNAKVSQAATNALAGFRPPKGR